MGASKDKKLRAEAREEGLNPREKALAEENQKNRKTRIKYTIIGILIALFVIAVILVNSSLFSNGLAALKVNDTKYTLADANYAYQTAYMNFTNTYGDYAGYFLDSSKPLDEQESMFGEGTWHEYFLNAAKENLVQITAFSDAARNAGYTLTDDMKNSIENNISYYSAYASLNGTTLDGFLAANFGKGNNEKTVRAHLEQELLANAYLQDLANGYTFTEAEQDAYYKENADELNTVSYLYTYIAATADEENGVDEETALTEAEISAKEILSVMTEDSEEAFSSAVTSCLGTEATSTTYSVSSFVSLFEGDVTADSIEPGMSFTHVSTSGVYAVYVTGTEDNNYNEVSVRHILVKAVDEDGDGTYSDAEKKAAYDAIVEIQNEWLAGAADEDSFAQLATLKSEDTGSASNGGLYENIYKGQMVPEFDAFCFDEHKAGDTAIVYGESSSYCGYHLVYFVSGDGALHSRTLADNNLRQEKYEAETAALLETYTAQECGMWHYVMK